MITLIRIATKMALKDTDPAGYCVHENMPEWKLISVCVTAPAWTEAGSSPLNLTPGSKVTLHFKQPCLQRNYMKYCGIIIRVHLGLTASFTTCDV